MEALLLLATPVSAAVLRYLGELLEGPQLEELRPGVNVEQSSPLESRPIPPLPLTAGNFQWGSCLQDMTEGEGPPLLCGGIGRRWTFSSFKKECFKSRLVTR